MDDTVKILIIDSGKTPIHTEKYEFASTDPNIKSTILNCLNKYGKGCHALMKFRNEYFVADHTAQGKIESEKYHRTKIKYHPFMKELV